MVQAVHSSIQMPILRCKMLVGDTPNPFTLHRSDAGCAFLRNALPGDALRVIEDLHQMGCRFI